MAFDLSHVVWREEGAGDMTSRQRRAHLVLWLVLVPIALVGLWLALVWRPAEPVQDGGLPGVAPETEPGPSDGGPSS